MGSNAQPRRLLLPICLLALFGCTTHKPAPTSKPEPPITATPPAEPAPPSTTISPVAPKLPPPPTSLLLSDGPWTECTADEATIAVTVTVRTNGLFRDRVGIHYLRPAKKTTYRLVQLRSNTPVTLAQKEIPEACSSAFHLANDEDEAANNNYSIHSTLKQTPIDQTHAITLNLRVNWRQNDASEHSEQSLVLNGFSRTECGQGAMAATIEILTPESAKERLAQTPTTTSPATPPAPAPDETPTPSKWDALYKKFQLTGKETRAADSFQLSGDASIQFPDIRFFSDLIEISEDHSLIKLHGPVRIDWDGRIMTSDDATIRISTGRVQFEASNIQVN